MLNRVSNSPIELTERPDAWSWIPQVPLVVQDAFGAKALVVLDRERWRGLIPSAEGNVFAWLVGDSLRRSKLSTRVTRGQTLASDEHGRALVIGGTGNSLYAVEPTGAALCLGVLADEQSISAACWLARGGVAATIGGDLCIYTPGADGQLRPRLRFHALHSESAYLRSLPSNDDEVFVVAAMDDERGTIYAVDADARAYVLADFEQLELADVQLFLDETGQRTMLPAGAAVSLNGGLASVEGLEQAIAMREQLPLAELSVEPAPELELGLSFSAPGKAEAQVQNEAQDQPDPDALTPPSLDRLGPLTRALIRMLQAAPRRTAPQPEILQLIRSAMPEDLRAYVHAWAVHAPSSPAVYEFWAGPPRLEEREFIRKLAGEAIMIGSFASGEVILARRRPGPRCEVVMIDEEGGLHRYDGLEGFLADLQSRARGSFELDDWVD